MENKKDVGTFFKSKLDEAQKTPSDSLWDKINDSLDKKEKKQKRRFLLLFPTITVLGVLGFIIFQETDNASIHETEKFSVEEINGDLREKNWNEKSTVVNASEVEIENKSGEYQIKDKITEDTHRIDEDKAPSKSGSTKYASSIMSKSEVKNSEKAKNISDAQPIKSSKNKTDGSLKNSQENDSNIPLAKVDHDSIPENESIKKESSALSEIEKTTSIPENDSIKKDSIALAKMEKTTSIPENDSINKDSTALAKMEKSAKKRKKKTKNDSTEIQKTNSSKWTIIAIGGPVFFDVSKNTSTIDKSLDGIETSGNINFAYGLGVGFNLNEKLSISYAAIRTKLGYSIKNIPSSTTQDLSRIHSFSAIAGQNKVTSEEFFAFTGNDETINLRQEIEYVEMPLQLTYSLTDSRLGVQVFGGFSTFLLTEDTIYLENSADEKLTLGSANNLSRIKFSINAGFGAYYKLSDKFTVEINPTFKYHLKLLDSPNRNGSGISIGLYTGIKYNLNTK